MKQSFKRVLSLLLVISMMCGMIVMPVSAEEYTCGAVAHSHGENCYEERLVCEEHVHSDECDADCGLICEEDHEHVDECYEVHEHNEDCYELVLVCTEEEHIHGAECVASDNEDVDTASVEDETTEDEVTEDEVTEDETTEDETTEDEVTEDETTEDETTEDETTEDEVTEDETIEEQSAEEDTSVVRDEENMTLTLTDALCTEGITLPDGWTIIVSGDCYIDGGDASAITGEGSLAITGEGSLTLTGSNGIMAASVSIEDIAVDFEGSSCGIQVYNDEGDATVTLSNVDGDITGGYAGIYVNGECEGSDAYVTIEDCELDVTSTATSFNDRARKAGITVYVSKAEKVESSITIVDSKVNAIGSDAGLSINNYLGDADATNSASSKINIEHSTVVAHGTNGTWSGIFASVLGQHPDADSIITITDSTVYAVSPNTGILTSSQKGESKIILNNSVLGASGKTALSMIEPGNQAQAAELNNGSTYIQMTPAAVMKGEIVNHDGKTIIATAGAGITYDENAKYFVIPQGSAVTESFTDGEEKEYTFNKQAGGVGGFDYAKEEIWGYDVPDPFVPVCRIVETGVEYETLTEAVAAANALEGANTIEMLQSIEFDSDKALSVSGDLTIIGGYTISRGAYTGTLFTVPTGSSLTLDGITVDGDNEWTLRKDEYMAALNSAEVVPDNATTAYNRFVEAEEGAPVLTTNAFVVSGELTLTGGTVIQNHVLANGDNKYVISVANGGTLVMDEAVLKHNAKCGSHTLVNVSAGGTWTVDDAEITDNFGFGNGCLASVQGNCYINDIDFHENYGFSNGMIRAYGSSSYVEFNDGKFYSNYMIADANNNWNAMFYIHNTGCTFIMNGGSITDNIGTQCGGLSAKQNGTLPNITVNNGVIDNNVCTNKNFAQGKDIVLGNPIVVNETLETGEVRLFNDITNNGTVNADVIYLHGWLGKSIEYNGNGTVHGDVYVFRHANTVMESGAWKDGMVIVNAADSIDKKSSLTVKPGATIDGIQVRVLDSVPSGDYLNAEESAAAQAASYIDEGGNVVSPVLYYHRLMSAQKAGIVVTFDYNGGLDAQNWSGCQMTSDSSFVPVSPQPTKGNLRLAGWVYANNNDPESLSMEGGEAYKGEEITESVRLIAQWEEPEYVCYIAETGVYYETLAAAVADANASEGDDTIVMIKDINFDSDKTLSITGNVTITSEPAHEDAHTISRGAYTGTLFTVPAGSSLTLDGGIVFDGSNNWIFEKELYENDLYNRVDNAISAYAYSAEGGTCGTAAAFVVNGAVTAKDVTIKNFFSTKDSNAGDAAIFKVNANATLITDGALIDHCATYGANTVAHLAKDAKWYIQGDTMISNNFGGRNGGICRNDSGQIYMSGGTIKDTAGKNVNGTVFMMYGVGSQFIMTGGTICGNSSTFGVNNGRCAAVYLHANSYMKMTGGTICHNIGGTRGGIDSYKSSSVLDINRVDQDFENEAWKESGAAAYTASNHPYIIDNVSLIDNTNHDVGHSFNFDTWWVTGGIYTQDVDEFCAEGYICIPYEDSERTDDYIVVPGYRVKYFAVEEVEVTNAETGETTTELQTTLVKKYFHMLPRDKFWYEMDERANYFAVTLEDGGVIDTWYTEKELTNLYDFENSKLESDLDLYGEVNKLTITYDYNGGADAAEQARSSVSTNEKSYNPVKKGIPAPTNGNNTLIGWKYAVDNDPESTDMTDNGKWYMGETLTENTRLIAQWEDLTEEEPEKEDPIPIELGTKTDELKDRDENRYTVNIDVPGANGITGHDEIILMVDGSYSLDQEWPAMKEALNLIGETVLNGSGTTKLTLMAFGMGDNIVLEHVTEPDALAAALGNLPGSLLYGRSSTNCEAGFDGVANYIKNHDNTLNDVHVVYISDGNINTDETPRAFAQNWKTWATQFGALTVAQAAFEGAVGSGENLPAAFTAIFGDRFAGATREEILSRAFGGEVTEEEFFAFADQVWVDVYAYSGLHIGVEYPVSVAERAFVKYDKEMGTYIQDAFYYTTYKSSYVTYPNGDARTIAAAEELAAMEEVEAMYVVDYDSVSAWMSTGITNEKVTFVQSNGIKNLCTALQGALGEMAKAPINDPVITDYMSKWVNLDADTLKIIDNNTGEVMWTVTDGWLTDNVPTAKNPPVVVELVDPADYAAGGEDVIGNVSGNIYKLTWYLKDGAMLRSDDFRLSYEVTVDTKEEGFEYYKDYPANGNTFIEYKDDEGNEKGNDIEVPDVNAEAVTLKLQKVDENGNPMTGAEFELFTVDENGNKTSVGTYAVDENGEYTLQLTGTKHLLVETKAPSGYLTAGEAIEIAVEGGSEIKVKETKAASYENGVLTVINRPPHAAVVLTIDMSGTMYRNKMDGKRYVDVAKAKAVDFVTQYSQSTSNGGKHMVAVVCFDTDAKIQQNWIDVSTTAGLNTAVKAINAIKVADNGSASSNQVCTNFDAGVILSRNLLKQSAVSDIDRCFTIILSDGAPTVTVNADSDTVGTIKSSFWTNQLDASGKKYQNARAGGGWTHPAEVAKTLTYLSDVAELTHNYTVNGEEREGIFIVGVGGLMNFKLFYDAVYGTSNGTRTTDVKRKPAVFNNIDALAGYTQAQIMKMTTGEWMDNLAGRVGGTYETATNTKALQNEFTNILNAIKDTTTPARSN